MVRSRKTGAKQRNFIVNVKPHKRGQKFIGKHTRKPPRVNVQNNMARLLDAQMDLHRQYNGFARDLAAQAAFDDIWSMSDRKLARATGAKPKEARGALLSITGLRPTPRGKR